MRTEWTKSEIDDFRAWHEKRMEECGYSLKVQADLRQTREMWLPVPKVG